MNIEEKARLAQELLNNPLLSMAISDLKEDLVNKWANSDSFDKEGRQSAYVFHRALSMILSKLQGYVGAFVVETYNTEQRLHFEDL